MIEDKAVIQLIESEIKKLNTNFGQWEQIKKFTLLPAEWTSESGELTPTMKVKRKIISERYRKQIEEMYT